MPVPVAVAPSVRSPGAYLSVNLLAGASTPGSGQLKVLVLATKSSVGTITPDTQLVQNVGPSEGETYFGTGTPGHLALKALFPEYGLASVDIMAPLVSGGVVASVVLTFASTPTIARTFILQIAGRQIATTWVAGVSASVFGDQVVALIAGLTSNLPVTAANITGAVTISAKYAGSWANDIVVYALLTGGSGGTVNAGQTVTTTLGSGTLSADPTNCLSVVQTREYAFILLCDGNTAALISGWHEPVLQDQHAYQHLQLRLECAPAAAGPRLHRARSRTRIRWAVSATPGPRSSRSTRARNRSPVRSRLPSSARVSARSPRTPRRTASGWPTRQRSTARSTT
jgi:hypothetical protein